MRMRIAKQYEIAMDEAYSEGQLSRYRYAEMQEILKKVKLLESTARSLFKYKLIGLLLEHLEGDKRRYFLKVTNELEEVL